MNERRLTILSAKFMNDVADEMQRARTKFPNNIHMHAALAEEAGEVANALLERDYKDNVSHQQTDNRELRTSNERLNLDVWKECVQTAAMALRVATEGDPSFLYEPPYYEDVTGPEVAK